MTFEVVALANKNESILIHLDVRLAYLFNINRIPVPGTFSFSILCRRSWLKTEGLQPAPGPGGVWLQELREEFSPEAGQCTSWTGWPAKMSRGGEL